MNSSRWATGFQPETCEKHSCNQSGGICDIHEYQWKYNMDPLYDDMVERMYDVMFQYTDTY